MSKRFTTGMAQIEPRFILWRKIRIPLFVAIILILLAISGVLLRAFLISRGIRNELEEATELSATDTFEAHQEALEILEQMRVEHPGNERVMDRYAWQRVLMLLRFGVTEQRLQAARDAVDLAWAPSDSTLMAAARAGLALAEGEHQRALELIADEPETREVLFVRGLTQAGQEELDSALGLLDQARQGSPPFVPALSELALMLRERGRYVEARAALEVITKASPRHDDALVQGVLLELDSKADSPAELSKLLDPLSETIAGIDVDESRPRVWAYKSFAEGRLALLRGEVEAAKQVLGQAQQELTSSQPVATWLAVARRRAGEHEKALTALERFPDAPGTDRSLIKTRLDLLLDLHRTDDARAPLEVLTKLGPEEGAIIRARLLVADAEREKAIPLLSKIVEAGHPEAGLTLAEIQLDLGRAQRAQKTLAALSDDPRVGLCAKGIDAHIEGKTIRARELLQKAADQGERCGPIFAGRLLMDAGIHQGQAPHLAKALERREDLRDRVLLGRMLLRTKGAAAARQQLDEVRSLRPQGAAVLRELVLAYRELQELDRAQEVAAEALELSESHPIVVAAAAEIARERGEGERAEELVDEAFEQHPDSQHLKIQRAANLYERERYANAAEVIEEALDQGALLPDAICLRSHIQIRRGEREDAQVFIMRSLSAAREHSGVPAEAAIRACLVSLHLRRGPSAFGRAKTAHFYLTRMPNKSAEISFLSGWIAERDSRISNALDAYGEALLLDPAHRETWSHLARISRLSDEQEARFQKVFPGQTPRGQ